jgi:hypothetical protein
MIHTLSTTINLFKPDSYTKSAFKILQLISPLYGRRGLSKCQTNAEIQQFGETKTDSEHKRSYDCNFRYGI